MSATNLTATQAPISQTPSVEELSLHDSSITLRRVEGVNATELYFACKPSGQCSDAGDQARAMFSAIRDVLLAEGGSLESIVSETIFLRDMQRDIESVREAITSITSKCAERVYDPARTEIQQPPLDTRANVEIAIQALIPESVKVQKQQVCARSSAESEVSKALRIQMEGETRLIAGTLCGDGDTAYDQTWSMFKLAEKLLHEAGMDFKDVVRTWIYLSEMERDYYPGLNKARREFFDSRGIDPVPASTGIEGSMVNPKHVISMGFYAVKSDKSLMRTVMTTPTLNEAGEYGADFTRGMKMVEANKIALHVSGTASIDEQGRTAHLDDTAKQIDRMILNIRELLAKQGADFQDIAYAYNYLKHPEDEQLLRDKFKEAGLEGFPSVFVHAAVCRPDLLCETEVFATLPRTKNLHGERPYLMTSKS